MENNKGKSEDSLKRMDKKAFWLGISAVVGILGLPYLVTQCSFGYYLGVKDANEIGDTLGGVLGPFIGFISAFLVYLALREQIKANKFLTEEIEKNLNKDLFIEIYKLLSNEVEKLSNINTIIKGYPGSSPQEVLKYEIEATIENTKHTDTERRNISDILSYIVVLTQTFVLHENVDISSKKDNVYSKILYIKFIILMDLIKDVEFSKINKDSNEYMLRSIISLKVLFKRLHNSILPFGGIEPIDFSDVDPLKEKINSFFKI